VLKKTEWARMDSPETQSTLGNTRHRTKKKNKKQKEKQNKTENTQKTKKMNNTDPIKKTWDEPRC